MNDLNYDELGLRIGIEIHQQLASQQKLFCHCPNQLQGTRAPDFEVLRKQRPVLGEEGKFDKGMLVEFLKKGSVVYEGYYDSTCTYELDETPPFSCNEECIDIVLEIAHLLHMNIVREMHVCRKNYVDGSVPGGFQRTMELGQNGHLLLKSGKEIGIENIFLEEDAARRSKTEGKTSYFRIDRLGIPLTEITTTPDIHDPYEAKEAAYRIGLLLRSTNKVKRVLGSTRQDINISIKHGERIEIKGVQKLDWIPALVDFECHRQLKLIEIKNILTKGSAKIAQLVNKPVDLTSLFQDTDCKFVKAGIKKGLKFTGMKIAGFKNIFGTEVFPNIRFGTEVAGKVKVLTGLKGLIHSDEDLVGKYQFSEAHIAETRKLLSIGEHDLFVLLLAKGQALETAIDVIIGRTKAAFKGVPEETRQAQEDGTHIFLRELGGEKRLYPDTDSPAIILSEERIERIKTVVGPYPWEVIDAYSKKHSIAPEIVEDLIMRGNLTLYDKLITILPDNPTLVIRTITDMVKVLHRDKKNTEQLKEHHFVVLITGVKNKEVAKEAMEPILEIWTRHPSLTLVKAKEQAGITSFDLSQLDDIVQGIIEKNLDLIKARGRGAMGPLMGDLMKAVGRGSIDGKILSSKLNQALAPHLPAKSVNKKKNKEKKDNKSPKSPKNGGKN